MMDRETRVLTALVSMVRQYLPEDSEGVVDTLSMSAGEQAVATLVEFGLMEAVPSTKRLGRWTEAGKAF